jgi:uncharacterized membrane protein
MVSAKARRITLWSLSGLLALLYLFNAVSKLANLDSANGIPFDAQFVAWGYPAWMRFVVGSLELAGAAGLLVPALRFYAACGLVLLMLGAAATHVANAEWGFIPVPLVPGAIAVFIASWTRPDREQALA